MRQPLVSTVGLKVRRQPNAMRDEEMLVCTLLCLPQGSGCAPTAREEAGSQHQGLLREAGCTDPYSWMGFTPRS